MKRSGMIFFLLFLQINLTSISADEVVSAITRDGSFIQCQDRAIYYVKDAVDRSIVSQWQQNDWLILQENNPHQIVVHNQDDYTSNQVIAQRMYSRESALNRIHPYLYQNTFGYEMILNDGTPWEVYHNYSDEIGNWYPGDQLYIAEDPYNSYDYIINFNEGNYVPFYLGN